MVQSLGVPIGILDEVLSRIVAHLKPTRIFLFGSRARSDARGDSDYDLIVEVDLDSDRDRADRTLLNLCEASALHIDAQIRVLGEISQRMHDHGAIDWDVAREAVIIYARADLPTGRPTAREKPSGPPPSVNEWWTVAQHDLYLLNTDDNVPLIRG